jgi:ATP-dependent helicase/nuclease subunit A
MATAAGPTLAPSLTEHQRQALETRDVNVALSAGAGCGKTFVLTQRFLSHLEPDGRGDAAAQLGRLIAITFTERAAREMRERIRAGVRDRLMKAPAEQEAHWLEILRRIDSARISTIHSFCGTLLRSNAVEAQLDPGFSILEPTAARQLLDELIDDRLRELLSEQNDDMLELTAGFDLNGVRQRISGLLTERFRLKFEDWLPLGPRDLVDQWKQFHETHIKPAALDELRNAPAVRKLRDETLPQVPPHPKLAERAVIIAELLCRIAEQDPTDADFDAIAEHAKVVGCTGKKIWAGQEELYEAYKEGFEALRTLAKEVRGKLIFDAVGALPAAEATLRFIRLAAPIRDRYEERKRSLGVLDFDDLLLRAHVLLRDNEPLRKRIAMSTELLLVDECQDTDQLQIDLINDLVGGMKLGRGKLFHVGDFKQSIYRFRGAEPQVFQRMQEATAEHGRIPLFLNFRSQPAVLDFVNVMFAPIFGEQYQPLAPSKEQVSPSPAIEFMWAYEPPPAAVGDDNVTDNDSAKKPAKQDAETLRRIEADWIARRIAGLVRGEEPRLPLERNSPKPKAGEPPLRPVRYGDCALLFRALSNVAIYEAALERYGIPYYVVGGKAFYAQQEIYDLLNFLRVLDSVCDDVALAGVLRSPFFSLADEDLYWLAQHKGGLAGGLFASQITDELEAEPRRKAEFAARTLRELREIKNRVPIAELINEIFARTAYDAIVTAEFLGDRKLANLRKLIEQARAFDASGIFTLTAFIEQLSTSVVEQPDEAPAAAFAEGANVVRLMSIHQSKGLEFPVVFVPDLERKRQHNRATVAFHPELGPMVGPPYREDGASGLDLYRLVENLEDEAESKRLFYVATTRAADYLVLSAGVEDPAEPAGEWRTLLAERFDLTTGKVLGALPPGMRSPDVHVIGERPQLDDDRTVKRERADWPKILEQVRKAAKSPKAKLREGTEPIAADLAARRRFSFSRLSGKIISAEDAEEERGGEGDMLTSLAEESTSSTALDGRTIGIAVHDALAKFDYRALGGTSQRSQAEKLVRRALDGVATPSNDEIGQLLALVEKFLASPRARSIAAARQVHRELEFLLSWPLDKPTTDGIYLQGFLDLLYEDAAGRWCVVDYKTHQAASANVSVAADPYKLQLAVYALAVEKILGRAPDELVLVFLRTGEEFSVPWNNAARRRAIEAVNQGLAAALQGERGP